MRWWKSRMERLAERVRTEQPLSDATIRGMAYALSNEGREHWRVALAWLERNHPEGLPQEFLDSVVGLPGATMGELMRKLER